MSLTDVSRVSEWKNYSIVVLEVITFLPLGISAEGSYGWIALSSYVVLRIVLLRACCTLGSSITSTTEQAKFHWVRYRSTSAVDKG